MAIYASIKDLYLQCAMSSGFKKALDYLSDFDPALFDGKMPGFVRKTVISGESVYAVNQVYATRPLSKARFEAHRKYIDVQVVWSGEELIPVAFVSELDVETPYQAGKDIVFLKFRRNYPSLIMTRGMAAVFYPSDAHAPCISHGRRSIVAKTVVKVRIGR